MAALWQARASAGVLEVADLRRLPAGALDHLLEDEIEAWRVGLHWDFQPSADLVKRYVQMRALDGFALLSGSEAVGYIYWVSEEHKALIGDLYVMSGWRSAENENLLLESALTRLTAGPHFTSNWVRRVEGQLMQSVLRADVATPHGPRPRGFTRQFLIAPAEPALLLPARPLPDGMTLQSFGPRWVDAAAGLIAHVYADHIDSEINDQYRSAAGSRKFLQNVVQYPGCGVFQPSCSYVLIDAGGTARALVLSSLVASDVGHIPQICVDPALQGKGAGYELLRRGMSALARAGAQSVSLTVTAANTTARDLYLDMGFCLLREFDALIWDGLSE